MLARASEAAEPIAPSKAPLESPFPMARATRIPASHFFGNHHAANPDHRKSFFQRLLLAKIRPFLENLPNAEGWQSLV